MKQTALRCIPPALAAVVALACLLLCPPRRAMASELKVGDTFPDPAAFGLEGELPATLKGKIVVVDFWASWCDPCRRTFPLMEELHHRFSKQGLVILAINEDKSRAAMSAFLKESPVTFGVVRDARKKLAAEVRVPALPTSYILDREGKVISIQSGESIVRSRRKFVKDIEDLLAKEPAKP